MEKLNTIERVRTYLAGGASSIEMDRETVRHLCTLGELGYEVGRRPWLLRLVRFAIRVSGEPRRTSRFPRPDLVRFRWSSSWNERHPFSFKEELMPWIGTRVREEKGNRIRWIFLGPAAVLLGWSRDARGLSSEADGSGKGTA